MSVTPRPVDERILSELHHARILGLMGRTPLSEAQKHALDALLDAGVIVGIVELLASVWILQRWCSRA